MKVFIFVLGVIATSQAVPLQRGLAQDFEDFKALLPLDKLKDLYEYYLENDQNFRDVVNYFTSEEAKKVLDDVLSVPEVQEFVGWVKDNWSVPERSLFRFPSSKAHRPGFAGFVDEVLDLLPLEKLWGLAFEKVKAGGAFAELYYKVQGGKQVYEKVLKLPSVVQFLGNLKTLGVDFDRLNSFVHNVFGWS